MDVEPTSGRQGGIEPDAVARAVHQSIAEVRRRNALVVAWVRIVLRSLTLPLYAYQRLSLEDAAVGWVIPVNLGHLVFAVAVAWLLVRRWRVTQVAFCAAAVDVAVVFLAGLHATMPSEAGALMGYSVAYLGGVMQVMLLFAAVALPARLTAPLAAAVIVFQGVLGVRGGIPPPVIVLGILTAAAFAFVVVWTGVRMVRLAAGMAVTEAAASLAEHHAHSMEAAHAEMAAQRDRLVSAQNEAEALAQVIVHDLKNPLATLLQYVSLAETELKNVPGGTGMVDYLEHASEEGRRLSKLIGDLLLVYRLERGVMAPVREQVPLKLLLQAVTRRFALRAAERGTAVELDAEEDLVVAADLDLTQRMLENLVSNALRHVNRGDRVRLEAHAQDEEIRIAVRNSGPPVSPELRGRLFDRFVTGGRREWQNAGLGLYLCRLVAEAHAGSISLVDAPGWNVSFEVTLPVSPPAAEGRPAAALVSGAP